MPVLERVRRRFPEEIIHIDCNSGYRLSDFALFEKIDEFDLAMIEQPLAARRSGGPCAVAGEDQDSSLSR